MAFESLHINNRMNCTFQCEAHLFHIRQHASGVGY
jgi:hypothetical protein